jgi:hypothetical protein
VLVAGAGMLTRSLINLEHQNFGFETANRVTVNLNSPPATYSPERLDALYRNLEERLGHLPSVERASLALYNPFIDNWSDDVVVQGHPSASFNERGGASWDRVSAGYFETIGQPIIRGRGFIEADAGRSAPVAVVNQAFVQRFFPKEGPLDKHFSLELPSEAGRFRIIGVVRDAKYAFPDEPVHPMFFVPLAQSIAYDEPNLKRGETRSHLRREFGAYPITRRRSRMRRTWITLFVMRRFLARRTFRVMRLALSSRTSIDFSLEPA